MIFFDLMLYLTPVWLASFGPYTQFSPLHNYSSVMSEKFEPRPFFMFGSNILQSSAPVR